MAKLFNLKTYKKTPGDEHITMRLKEQHENTANVITEKQLSDRRVDEKNVIMEKLLDAKRTGGATVVTERNLNESKGMFAPLRNEKTYTGNINKVEEQRLKGKTAESEKYEPASEIPKKKRWWDNLKDANVEASTNISIRTSQTSNKKRRVYDNDSFRFKTPEKDLSQFRPEDAFGLATKMEGAEESVESPTMDIPVGEVEEDDVDENMGDVRDGVWLDEANGYKETRSPIATMTFKFKFNAEQFQDLEDVRQAALEEAIKLKPNLEGKISTMDFLQPEISGEVGTILLPLIGDEYFEGDEAGGDAGLSDMNIIDADKIYTGKKDVDGTPMVTGLVYLTKQGIEMAKNEPVEFEKALSDAIMEARPELDKVIDTLVGSFNLAKAPEGKVSFMVSENLPEEEGVSEEDIANANMGTEASINDDFQITVISNKK